jgi:2-amino-4-hydroxy-6-hydroxymethyldihydropteridine diphosphokinase
VKKAYLALGSNIGDREAALQKAIDRLHSRDLQVRRISSVYEGAAMYYEAQPDFVNCVLEADTELLPMRLLARIQKIEREMGRKRLIPKGPRTIDIDILFHGDAVVKTPTLELPHPRLEERRFVLEPLFEIAPDLRHPVHRRTVREILAAAPHQRLVRLAVQLAVPLDRGQE